MIRAKGQHGDGRPFILLGVTRENVRRLTAGEPIRVTGVSIAMPEIESIVITFGETEAAIVQEFREFFGPETIVHLEGKPGGVA